MGRTKADKKLCFVYILARVPTLRSGKKNKNKIYANISMVNLAFVYICLKYSNFIYSNYFLIIEDMTNVITNAKLTIEIFA